MCIRDRFTFDGLSWPWSVNLSIRTFCGSNCVLIVSDGSMEGWKRAVKSVKGISACDSLEREGFWTRHIHDTSPLGRLTCISAHPEHQQAHNSELFFIASHCLAICFSRSHKFSWSFFTEGLCNSMFCPTVSIGINISSLTLTLLPMILPRPELLDLLSVSYTHLTLPTKRIV